MIEATTIRTAYRALAQQMSTRGAAIHMLEGAVRIGDLDRETADRILLEYDAVHFPTQIPQPLREAVLRDLLAESALGKAPARG